jgi:anaerobic ribonucleoside-triphosphate reductase activating protein
MQDVSEDNPAVLRLYHRSNRCTVLGPGVRAVLWVQGCSQRCPGCISPEGQPLGGGTELPVAGLAAELAGLGDIEGLTFSGGEPMLQATAIASLIDAARARRGDLTTFCYSGYTLEQLLAEGSAGQKALLARLDVLVDGPYVQARHTDLRWRGADNQRGHFLTDRYRDVEPRTSDRGPWLEFEVDAAGVPHWMGIPPPGFREKFEQAMRRKGIELLAGEDQP